MSSYPLTQEILDILTRPETMKILSTVDEAGTPHAVPTPFLDARPDGLLVHLELLETSTTNRNLLRSLWYDRPAAVTLVSREGAVFAIEVAPIKVLVSGPTFTEHFRRVAGVLGESDLTGVWLLRPVASVEETYDVRRRDEERRHPFSVHLDRLLASRSAPTKESPQ